MYSKNEQLWCNNYWNVYKFSAVLTLECTNLMILTSTIAQNVCRHMDPLYVSRIYYTKHQNTYILRPYNRKTLSIWPLQPNKWANFTYLIKFCSQNSNQLTPCGSLRDRCGGSAAAGGDSGLGPLAGRDTPSTHSRCFTEDEAPAVHWGVY